MSARADNTPHLEFRNLAALFRKERDSPFAVGLLHDTVEDTQATATEIADRFGQSALTFPDPPQGSTLVLNQYSSNIHTIQVHVGLSIHFDIKP